MSARTRLQSRILALIDACRDGTHRDHERDALLHDIVEYQADTIAPYARFCAQRRVHPAATGLDRHPALPTDAFRFARLVSHAATDDVRCFVSSGTTHAERSRHPFRDLTLYDAAAHAAARYALFPDGARMQLLVLAPDASALPESSLSYMLSRFVAWFGTSESVSVWRDGALDLAGLSNALVKAESRGTPLALLGTSFGFVHAVDGLAGTRFELPRGSRIMQTGGFKGRSRQLDPASMRALLGETFGVDDALIVAEYGMTELSSQLYETTLREAVLGRPVGPRRLWIPGWLRAVPTDPESSLPCPDARPGLLRVDDPANLDSISCIQTADVARTLAGGLVVTGRAEGAVERGCSIAADELLGGAHGRG